MTLKNQIIKERIQNFLTDKKTNKRIQNTNKNVLII